MQIMDVHGRREPSVQAAEREMLDGWLDYHRATILAKVEGLDDEALRRPGVPSGTSLLGIVKHLALAEHHWFEMIFAGACPEGEGTADGCPCGLPWPNGPGAWTISPDETTEQVTDSYVGMCARSREITSTADLDDRALGPPSKRQHTLRWIVTHMIEETARHNGHADILREQIDGSVGV